MQDNDRIGDVEDWKKAGRIAAEALDYGRSLIKKGALHREVLDKVEEKIISLGGEPAFPAQASMDDCAAHFCAGPDEEVVFEGQIVCLDVGAHVNGAIGDNACTVDLSEENSELVKASREALKNASKILQIGIKLKDIGKEIQETIESFGFRPVRNLSGHGLSRYNIHDFPTVPNFDNGDDTELTEGMVIAIEPFASDGAGIVYESENANIYSFIQKKPVRSAVSRELLKEISKYKGLPFTTRNLIKNMPAFKVNFALNDLLRNNIIRQYPPLIDKDHGLVSQAENTFYIGDKVEVLTKF